jgi:hypothetical protein
MNSGDRAAHGDSIRTMKQRHGDVGDINRTARTIRCEGI